MNIETLLNEVNKGLDSNKTLKEIGEELGISDTAIRKRLVRADYKRVANKYVRKEEVNNILVNTEVKEPKEIKAKEVKEVKEPKAPKTKKETGTDILNYAKFSKLLDNLDTLLDLNDFTKSNKFNRLIDNLDTLLEFSNKLESNDFKNLRKSDDLDTSVLSNIRLAKTFKIDSNLFDMLKDRAIKDNNNMSNIIEVALLKYLQNK